MSIELHVGTRKGLFSFRKESGTWRMSGPEFLGVQVPMLLPDPRTGALFVAVEHGHFGIKLHRRQHDAEAWEELAAPTYPAKPEDVPDVVCPMRQKPIPWSLEKIWSLEAGGPDQPGLLWCGTIPGGLFVSRDNGASWELVRSLWDRPERAKWFGGGYDYPGIHSVCVDPRDTARVTVAVSCGGVWHTDDTGQTWSRRADGMAAAYMPPEMASDPDIQDPHRMAQCLGAPDHLWVQHHCGIFRSTDAGRNWSPVLNAKPSDFGFAVAVHPRDPLTAWFAPAVKDECRVPVDGTLVVSRTRDGGASFEVLSKGLPEQPSYDLVYRHGLEVDSTGSRLAMGSTSGGLWVSEDSGESWKEIEARLPPVYCLRFAEQI